MDRNQAQQLGFGREQNKWSWTTPQLDSPQFDNPSVHPFQWSGVRSSSVQGVQNKVSNTMANIPKRKSDEMVEPDLEYNEYRVTKMYKIEPVAKGQFFEDSSGILWNGEEEEEYEEEVLTPTDDNLSGGNGSVDNLDAASSQKSGRMGPIKTAMRRSTSKS